MITGSGICYNLTAVAQCGACGVSHDVTFAWRVILLSTNTLLTSFKSWRKLDLLRQMVRLELVYQCALQGDGMEERACGTVGLSIIYGVEVLEKLDLVSWDVDNACLLLQSLSTWMKFAIVLSYSRLLVYVPNCVLVCDGCDMHEDYRSSGGSMMEHVEGVVGE